MSAPTKSAPANQNSRVAPLSDPRVQLHTARYLNSHFGAEALTLAIRQGMVAKQSDNEEATRFWCSVCSALIQMRQKMPPIAALAA